MPRKTIDVMAVKAKANRALATNAKGNTADFRRGIAGMLETILMDSGNYKGFRFTDGVLGKTDDTRREYY